MNPNELKMNITGDMICEHDEYGEVLVIDIYHAFDEYNLKTGSGDLQSRVVRYTPD